MQSSERRIFLVLIVCAVVMVSRGPNSMSGDAPHYLALSHSIVNDLDFELSNQYAPSSEFVFRPDGGESHVSPGRDGGRYPFHYTGLSIAMAPVFLMVETFVDIVPERLLHRVRWDRMRASRDVLSLCMAVLLAWTAVLTLRCCRRLVVAEAPVGLAVLQAFASPPLQSMALLAFTEVPAAFLSTAFLVECLRPAPRRYRLVLPLALLPWLHLRYAVVSIAGFLWVVFDERRRGRLTLGRGVDLTWIPLLSLALLMALNWWMFESPFLWGQFPGGFPLTLRTVWVGIAGQLVDRDFGLLAVAPFWVVSLTVLLRPGALMKSYVLLAGVSFAGTWLLASLNEMWWGGYSPPARFLVPVLPLMTPALAEGYRRLFLAGRAWVVYLALAYSMVMTATLLVQPDRLWTDPETALGVVAAHDVLHRSWPSLFDGYYPPGPGFVLVVVLLGFLTVTVWRRASRSTGE